MMRTSHESGFTSCTRANISCVAATFDQAAVLRAADNQIVLARVLKHPDR
jgi:hypothetical protein